MSNKEANGNDSQSEHRANRGGEDSSSSWFLKSAAAFAVAWAVVIALLGVITSSLSRRSFPERRSPTPVMITPATFERDEIAESLILVGDGGDATPVALSLLESELAHSPEATTAVFLGDNVYPIGLPPPSDRSYQIAVRRLERQLDVVSRTRVRAIFIPGNHDWSFGRADGWDAVRRQQQYVDAQLGSGHFAPIGGCPGPVESYHSPAFQVIALDTDWWLHPGPRPLTAESGCPTFTEDAIVKELTRLIAADPDGVRRILVSHHPLRSYGEHSQKERCPHDFGCKTYARMRNILIPLLAEHPPFICAAGHDHSIQIIEGERGCRHFLVSGALTNITGTKNAPPTTLTFDGLGFVRVDALRNGKTALTVIRVGTSPAPVRQSYWLDGP